MSVVHYNESSKPSDICIHASMKLNLCVAGVHSCGLKSLQSKQEAALRHRRRHSKSAPPTVSVAGEVLCRQSRDKPPRKQSAGEQFESSACFCVLLDIILSVTRILNLGCCHCVGTVFGDRSEEGYLKVCSRWIGRDGSQDQVQSREAKRPLHPVSFWSSVYIRAYIHLLLVLLCTFAAISFVEYSIAPQFFVIFILLSMQTIQYLNLSPITTTASQLHFILLLVCWTRSCWPLSCPSLARPRRPTTPVSTGGHVWTISPRAPRRNSYSSNVIAGSNSFFLLID